MAIYIVKAKKTSLKAPLAINATSAILRELVDTQGNDIAMASFGEWGVMVVKSGTKIEMIKFTGITQNANGSATITFATNGRNLLPITPYTGSATGSEPFQTTAEVIITNDPLTMATFGNLNNAQTWALLQTFTVIPKSNGTPVAGEDLVTKAYADALALGGATVDKLVVAGNAGETISGAGKLIYFDTTDDEWKLCDADTASTVENVMLGISQGSGTNGNTITGGVLIRGVDTNQSGLTIGDVQYASNTAGAISSSAGTTPRKIGIAKSTTSIYFDPYFGHLASSTSPTSFISASTGSSDAGKGIKTDARGLIDTTIQKNGFKPNAGATINGATLPVPVYQNKTDNEVYACDANDTSACRFIGFAITNSTNGNPITVITNGVVDGFTGLDEGEPYYVQDTVGTIGKTQGTLEILVGIAVSPTSLLIQKGRRKSCGVLEFGGTNVSSAVVCGFTPSSIKLDVLANNGGADICVGKFIFLKSLSKAITAGTIVAGGNTANVQSGSGFGTLSMPANDSSDNLQIGISSVTDTGFTVSITENSSISANCVLIWEAEGEI